MRDFFVARIQGEPESHSTPLAWQHSLYTVVVTGIEANHHATSRVKWGLAHTHMQPIFTLS